jgi:hypothetical protein
MQKWEYRAITGIYWDPKEGWEMVGCVPAARGDTHILYFKRPKADDDMTWPFSAGRG